MKASSPFSATELATRTGHAVNFLGKDLPLPLPAAKTQQRDWLHYTHFSVLVNRQLRQLQLAVVDIAGPLWRQISRAKGGDVWYPDPRIGIDEQPEQDLFQKPDPAFNKDTNDFAFGHMVRRVDPNWEEQGETGIAARAEQETFHLTNASPQAESLNSIVWNRLESMVLDEIKTKLKINAVVLTGPVTRADDPKLHGTFPIPREYWKIVAWRADDQLAAAGWRQKQPDDVLPPSLEAVRMPFDTATSNPWLVPIRDIQAIAALDLGVYVAADTYRLRRPQEAIETADAMPFPASAAQLLMTDVLAPDDTLAGMLGVAPSDLRAMREALAGREGVVDAPTGSLDTGSLESATSESAAPDSGLQVSPAAYALILRHETGGRSYYETVVRQRPTWPKYHSGITIGFGYDLGYLTRAAFERDWAFLPAPQRDLLAAPIGKHGANREAVQMRAELATVKHIVIEWPVAEAVFNAATLPKFCAATERALPNCDRLSPDSFGALVSLTFNRGDSYDKPHDPAKDPHDRYREMRAIKAAMAAGAFAGIPDLIRAMRRLWEGSAIEQEMSRRRESEAALFETGLAQPGARAAAAAVATESPTPSATPARPVIPAAASLWEGSTDEDFWIDLGEEELVELARSGQPLESPAAVAWAADAVSPDYAHLLPVAPAATFALTAGDLALLARLNDFPIAEAADTPILFGLRGCAIVRDQGDVVLNDQRPDHRGARCLLGVWNTVKGTVQVFPGSTVPNEAAVIGWRRTRRAGNLLPTGLYRYIVGPHATQRRDGTLNSRPGCFVLRETSSRKRVVVVRRSDDDLSYDVTDQAQRTAPGDNIHPTFFSTAAGFSSFGCQTVIGSADSTGKHTGPWAEFRQAAGLTTPVGTPGKPFLYLLLTGAEAALASELRRRELVTDPQSLRRLRRLRFGSRGDAVARLQAKLGVPNPDGDFGAFTSETLHRLQRGLLPKGRSDGIWSPDHDAALGFGVFGSIGT